jgi:DNA-binding transcriptional LysR family regulator
METIRFSNQVSDAPSSRRLRAMYDWAEFRHFRYLLAVLERQGFRPAAEELNASQPNLTVQARQFQENASVRLFRKTRNGRIRPTETGTAFIAFARLLLSTRNEVMEALRAIDGGEIRSLRFGCSPWVDQALFRHLCSMHKEILPACAIRPTLDDTAHLAEEVLTGIVDAAIVTLPLEHPDLHVEELQQERLVVCLRKDDPLASKASLRVTDLKGKLTVFYHPRRHPEAHQRLLELLEEEGIEAHDHSRASNPSELQLLVKEGHGFALVREGSVHDDDLTTRPIAGVNWTVDTALVYRKEQHPKTLPLVLKNLKLRQKENKNDRPSFRPPAALPSHSSSGPRNGSKRPSQSVRLQQAELFPRNDTRRRVG